MTNPNPAPENLDSQELTPQELKEQIAKIEADKNKLVSELTEDRKKRQELQDQINTLKEMLETSAKKVTETPEAAKIAETVKAMFAEKEASEAKSNQKAAFDRFISENKEFHPDNDPGGLKRAALEERMKRFNTSGLVKTEDFLAVIADAHRLLPGTDTTSKADEKPVNPYSSVPRSPAQPQGQKTTGNDLTPQEKEVIARNGWTEEKYLKIKAKQPDFFRNLFKPVV